ncbi:MAG: hypothetical protein V1874_05695 [Spirochaetota bacterium]
MKKLLLIGTFFLFVFAQVPVFAHAPSGIDGQVNQKSGELNIKIMHDIDKTPAKDVTKHFVKTVVIELNNVKLTDLSFEKQENSKFQNAKYKIEKPLKKGDKISITANCSIKGSYKKVILVK